MAPPARALQSAVLVAVPLALVVLIFVTPGLIGGPGFPQPTDIPALVVQIIGRPFDTNVNESALVYVHSALGGIALYDYIAVNLSDPRGRTNVTAYCGGTTRIDGANWTCSERRVPSIWLRLAVTDQETLNLTALTVQGRLTFRYNATVAFTWKEAGWTLRVRPEGAGTYSDYPFPDVFTDTMREEVAR